MIRKIEGLVLKKTFYKDRNIITHLLLRSGKKVSVIFYGAKIAGSSKKSSILEIGHMLKVELQVTKSTMDIYRAQEWDLIWSSNLIRDDFKAYSTMCLILETMEKIALEDDLHDENRDHDVSTLGYFNVVSNSLNFIDKGLENSSFCNLETFFIFLVKLAIHHGVFPTLSHCVLSGELIKENDSIVLIFEEGGFALKEYIGEAHKRYGQDKMLENSLWKNLSIVANHNFEELSLFKLEKKTNVHLFFNYICFHFHYFESDFKSLKMFINDR